MAKVVPRPQLTFWEQVYFVEIIKGLAITMGHAVRNLTGITKFQTLNYPEVAPDLPQDYRARHRLMKRPDGTPRCVACYMCSTACPARCINIIAEEAPDKHIEKRPVRFEIDLLLCVFCGYCVEACPCDAIRMDTREGVMAGDNRAEFIINKEKLMDWNPTDYPKEDSQSQKAPGGLLHAEALEAFKSGSYH
jgi:NADH-quinone oxidoreductase subunit I